MNNNNFISEWIPYDPSSIIKCVTWQTNHQMSFQLLLPSFYVMIPVPVFSFTGVWQKIFTPYNFMSFSCHLWEASIIRW